MSGLDRTSSSRNLSQIQQTQQAETKPEAEIAKKITESGGRVYAVIKNQRGAKTLGTAESPQNASRIKDVADYFNTKIEANKDTNPQLVAELKENLSDIAKEYQTQAVRKLHGKINEFIDKDSALGSIVAKIIKFISKIFSSDTAKEILSQAKTEKADLTHKAEE